MHREKTAAYPAAIRWFCIFLALAILAMSARAADTPLTADRPVPDETLLSMVINADYPQQTRMNAIARVAEQATDEDMETRVAWLVGIIKNSSAQPVIRGHALDQMIFLKSMPDDLPAWLLSSAGDNGQSTDWRIACISRFGGVYTLVDAAKGEDIVTLLSATAEGDSIPVAAASLIAMAGIGGLSETANTLVVAKLEKAFFSGSTNPEILLAAIQASVLLGDVSTLPAIRGIALDATRELRIRMSAIGALGELGNMDDAETINRAGSSSPLLRKVAGNAAARLYARQGD